ncbi:zinc finger protein [Sodiomyces alkalinus F11]|uniref:Zinc finger protein n=1 Tax=Sodiomyces alkalinus (strain CBS 110278 / VKM F-3762 / F11) TaxID=1314773 RepID=A0A3N2PNY3_SODAK|nr:zinc finger protein [Sodiomyces alkalinus F11]ROT36225.1 zinc finger protein [Sodiomyces alkalinus F11]
MASFDVAALGSLAVAGDSASHPFTCNTCAVAYRNIDLQRGHMKSDWHRYNLKRRVASLPPISSEIFNEKVLQARATQEAAAEKAFFERTCDACERTYSSENAYENHISSQKHKQRVAAMNRRAGIPDDASVMSSTFSFGDPIIADKDAALDSEVEEEFTQVVEGLKHANIEDREQGRPSPVKRPSNPRPSAQGQPDQKESVTDSGDGRESGAATPVASAKPELDWTVKSCIFCNYTSPTMELSAHHMERFHGMFIPEKPYLVDLEGLLRHLLERVHEGHQCLFCFKTKATAFAVQTHMRDKGHCKLPFDTEEEQLDIGDFYDFRSTYSDGDVSDEEGEGQQKGGAKLGGRRAASKLTNQDGDDVVEGEDGWETDSSASSLDSADLTAVPAERHDHQYERLGKHPHHTNRDPRSHHQADGWHSHAHRHTHAVFYDEYEMQLPSGKSVGHRSLNRYYRQNLHSYPTAEERAERLAIEAAGQSDDDGESTETEGNEDRRVARTDGSARNARNGRAVVRRDAAGMVGATGPQKREVELAEKRGRTMRLQREKHNDFKYGKKLNNQKTYYYRYQMGG